jgi:hypothetical protein
LKILNSHQITVNMEIIRVIRAPHSTTSIDEVNRQLRKLHVDDETIKIFNKEVTFSTADEKKKYIKEYEEQNFVNEYATISELRFFGRATVPSFVQVAARQKINDSRFTDNSWHVVVVGRLGPFGINYDPNFNPTETFDFSLKKIPFSYKVKKVLQELGLRPKKQSSKRKSQALQTRLFVGGGGNSNGRCRFMSFQFLQRAVITSMKTPLTVENLFGADKFHEIGW